MPTPNADRASRKHLWLLAFLAAAALFLALAISRSVYDLTSPGNWPLHLLARKLYSIVAFAIIGYFFGETAAESGSPARPLVAGGAIGLYSLCIEVAQHFVGSHEGFRSNVADVAAGIIGGAIGGAIALIRRGITV